jgi:hypothetical protein
MTFPTNTTENTLHRENGFTYIAKSGRWERYESPAMYAENAITGYHNVFTKQSNVVDFSHLQHPASFRIQIHMAFQPDSNVNPLTGFWSKAINGWIPKASYNNDDSDGQITWGSGGKNCHQWSAGKTAMSPHGFFMTQRDDSTRYCAANKPTTLDMRLIKLNSSYTMIDWRCFQTVNTANAPVQNLARLGVNTSISDITKIFVDAYASGSLDSGLASVEVF